MKLFMCQLCAGTFSAKMGMEKQSVMHTLHAGNAIHIKTHIHGESWRVITSLLIVKIQGIVTVKMMEKSASVTNVMYYSCLIKPVFIMCITTVYRYLKMTFLEN